MGWRNESGAYIPAGGERIRLSFSYSYVPFTALDAAEIRSYIEAAGFQVIDVQTGTIWPNTFSVELYAPGQQSMINIAQSVGSAVAESWRAWSVQASEYQTWTVSLIPEPSTRQTVALVAVAILLVGGIYLAYRAKVL